jgi:hypothetical protein
MRTRIALLAAVIATALCSWGCLAQEEDVELDTAALGQFTLSGTFYGYDGHSWNMLMVTRADPQGRGTYYSYFAGVEAQGSYWADGQYLVLEPDSPGAVWNTYSADQDWLSLENVYGAAVLFKGPLFCQSIPDCNGQADRPADGSDWRCWNYSCVPSEDVFP